MLKNRSIRTRSVRLRVGAAVAVLAFTVPGAVAWAGCKTEYYTVRERVTRTRRTKVCYGPSYLNLCRWKSSTYTTFETKQKSRRVCTPDPKPPPSTSQRDTSNEKAAVRAGISAARVTTTVVQTEADPPAPKPPKPAPTWNAPPRPRAPYVPRCTLYPQCTQ